LVAQWHPTEVGTETLLLFGDMGRFLHWLHDAHLEVLGDTVKNGGATDCCREQFSRGFLGIIATCIMIMS